MSQKNTLRTPAGLCEHCTYRMIVRSGRGSSFILCQRSQTDPTFPKYPRLPVVQCRGFDPQPGIPESAPEE